jgi:trk system potassium uptake protein TrkA
MTLHHLGYEVLGIDADEQRVNQALNDEIVSHALTLNSTYPGALKEAGLYEFDTVIVAIGNFIQESVITVLYLKEGGVPNVVAKASSDIHGKLLNRVGANHVVYPEHEMGCELARSLTRPGLLERFELDPNHSIIEVMVPAEFDDRTIAELNLRQRYGVNLLAICREGQFEINPSPVTRLQKGWLMVVIGSNQCIDRLPI